MTKKDYKKVSEILKNARAVTQQKQLDEPLRYITIQLAHMFKDDNTLFSYEKFYAACGMT